MDRTDTDINRDDDEDERENNLPNQLDMESSSLRENGLPLQVNMDYYRNFSNQQYYQKHERKKQFLTTLPNKIIAIKYRVKEIHLMKMSLMDVQGRFGMEVLNYFKFLKWVCALNMGLFVIVFSLITVPGIFESEDPKSSVICNQTNSYTVNNVTFYDPEFAVDCCSLQFNSQFPDYPLISTSSVSEIFSGLGEFLQDLLQGTGWMSATYFYYGTYTPYTFNEHIRVEYFYWFTILTCFILSLILIVRSSSNSFGQSFKWSKNNRSLFFDLTFCSWSFSFNSDKAVYINKGTIRGAMKAASFNQKWNQAKGLTVKLVLKRALCNIAIVVVLGSFFYALYRVFLWSPQQLNQQKCPSSDVVFSETSDINEIGKLFLCFLIEYSASLLITFANIIFPYFFQCMIKRENYINPRTQLLLNLFRCITIRITSLLLTIYTQYQRVNCEYGCYDDQSHTIQICPEENTMLPTTCSNSNIVEKVSNLCSRGICWENYVGQQFYILTIADFLLQLIIMLVNQCRWSLCRKRRPLAIEFDVTSSVLDVVYSQTICWMGLFFAPLITLVTGLKLIIIFFIKLRFVRYICQPKDNFYQASKISSFLKFFLLIGLIVSVVPLAFFIGNVTPSNSCGPFRNQPGYYNLVLTLIQDMNSEEGQSFIYFMGKMTTLYTILAVLLLLNYYFLARGNAQSALCNRIEEKLENLNKRKKAMKESQEVQYQYNQSL